MQLITESKIQIEEPKIDAVTECLFVENECASDLQQQGRNKNISQLFDDCEKFENDALAAETPLESEDNKSISAVIEHHNSTRKYPGQQNDLSQGTELAGYKCKEAVVDCLEASVASCPEPETGLGLSWCKKSFSRLPEYKANSLHHSGKLTLLLEIIQQCKEQGVKLLVFSQSMNSLDKIQEFIAIHNSECKKSMESILFLRLDGSTSQKERHSLVNRFNQSGGLETLFLISTKAGGVGLNLIAASRVVIFDSSWNPASDSQVCQS